MRHIRSWVHAVFCLVATTSIQRSNPDGQSVFGLGSMKPFAVCLLSVVIVGCGGGSSSSSSAPSLSGQWNFVAPPNMSGTVNLTQSGTQITGELSEPNYYGSVPGMGLPSISGTVNGNAFQATITGTYGPYACGEGTINIDLTMDLSGTVAPGGNSMSGQFVTQPTTCFSGNSGNWAATRK